jgi:hypothetical protein
MAKTAAGVALSCWTTDSTLYQAISKIQSDAFIKFTSLSDGQCSGLEVTNDSRYAPKIL